MKFQKHLLATSALAASVWIAAPAMAQTATSSDDASAEQGEIVVTAQRREERLIDVPLSVSAISERRLVSSGTNDVSAIGTVVPNIQINSTVGASFSPLISIRGLAPSSDTSLGRDQPVGIYINGVPMSKSTGAAFDTVDLQRVEVLRGPQGTLYGKNTIGGAINLVTRKPTGEFGGTLALGVGEYGYGSERLAVNLPAIETGMGVFKVKLAVAGKQGHSFMKQLGPSQRFDRRSTASGRADVVWEVSPDFQVSYSYDISDSQGTGMPLPISAAGLISPTGSLSALYPLIAGQIYADRPTGIATEATGRSNFNVAGHSLNLEYHLGAGALGDVTLKSITAWRSLRTRSNSDFDGVAADLLRFTLDNNYNQFSQEVQILGTADDFRYTIGGFYMRDYYNVYNPRWSVRLGNSSRYDLSDRSGRNRAIAAYGQFTFSPSALDNKLDLTVGLRWTKDTKRTTNLFFSYNNYLANPSGPLSGVFQRTALGAPILRSGGPAINALPTTVGGTGPYDLSPLVAERSWEKFTPEVSLTYKPSRDLSFYLRYATGFKSGGYNDVAATNSAFLTAFNPENLKSYEVGSKGSLFNNRLNFSMAYYHSVYTDFQAGVFVPALITTNVINAGKAVFDGFELEGSLRPIDPLTITFGYGHINPRYKDFVLPNGTNVTNTYKLPLVPRNNVQVGADLRIPVGSFTLNPSVNYSWRSSQWGAIEGDPLTARKAYGLLDARIALSDIELGRGTSLELAVWGKNLQDTHYWNSAINLGLFTVKQWGDPRSFGADLRLKF